MYMPYIKFKKSVVQECPQREQSKNAFKLFAFITMWISVYLHTTEINFGKCFSNFTKTISAKAYIFQGIGPYVWCHPRLYTKQVFVMETVVIILFSVQA